VWLASGLRIEWGHNGHEAECYYPTMAQWYWMGLNGSDHSTIPALRKTTQTVPWSRFNLASPKCKSAICLHALAGKGICDMQKEIFLSAPEQSAFTGGSSHVNIYLTSSIKQSPSWETKSMLSKSRNSHTLWNLKVYYHVHKSSPPVPILSQMNPIHIPKPCFPKINLNVILSPTPRSS
jgi:hypothetical protein